MTISLLALAASLLIVGLSFSEPAERPQLFAEVTWVSVYLDERLAKRR